MNTKSKTLVLASLVFFAAKAAVAGSPVCDQLNWQIATVNSQAFNPADQAIRTLIASGLGPWNLPIFVNVSGQFSQAYLTARQLNQLAAVYGCQPQPTQATQACQNILAVMPSVTLRFRNAHDQFAQLILSGNLSAAISTVPELLGSEDTMNFAGSIYQSACIPR